MPISIPLLNAARKLIETFGNTASLYGYAGATKSANDEGEVTVSNWGTATTIKVIDGGSQGQEMRNLLQGKELIGEDEKIIKDSVTVVVNDRLTYTSKEYRVTALRQERIESTTIIQIIKVDEVTATTTW
jgi:hypothetical protein